MKKIFSVILLSLLPAVGFSEEGLYDLYFESSSVDFEFTYLRVTAFEDRSYNPVSADGWYNGFSGAPNSKTWDLSAGPFEDVEGLYTFTVYSMDPANLSGYYFVAELLNESKTVVGFSDYADYGTIQAAREGIFEGYNYWAIGSFTAAPVPEPTSALLFLMGGALLGLRRKRRVA